jgi:uncharacterized glyoxalase superfamily protein PhnB
MSVYPCFRYRDAAAAIDFLSGAFGFEKVVSYEGEGGVIEHAELRLGDSMIMLGTEREDGSPSHVGRGWTYVGIEDTDALFDRARSAGAEVVKEPFDTDYGSRDFSVRDPEGNLWNFGTYDPVSAPTG